MASSLPGNSLSLSSVCQDEPREGCLRAILVYIWITDHNPSAQQAWSTWGYILDPFQPQAKPKRLQLYKAPHLMFVRGPFLPNQPKVGDPPVHILNLQMQNTNPTASPFLSLALFIKTSPSKQEDSVFQVLHFYELVHTFVCFWWSLTWLLAQTVTVSQQNSAQTSPSSEWPSSNPLDTKVLVSVSSSSWHLLQLSPVKWFGSF